MMLDAAENGQQGLSRTQICATAQIFLGGGGPSFFLPSFLFFFCLFVLFHFLLRTHMTSE